MFRIMILLNWYRFLIQMIPHFNSLTTHWFYRAVHGFRQQNTPWHRRLSFLPFFTCFLGLFFKEYMRHFQTIHNNAKHAALFALPH